MNNQEFKWDDGKVADLIHDLLHGILNTSNGGYHVAISQFKASKQKPVEYEVLEITLYGKEVWSKKSDGLFGLFDDGIRWDADYLFSQHKGEVTKVKRTSDNFIFSIGDEVLVYGEEMKIGRIFLRWHDRDGLGERIDDLILDSLSFKDLQKAEPKKQPILTTNDGCDVFEGGRFWFITPQLEVGLCSNAKNDVTSAIARFSIEENADNYVFENKPCLSIAEVYAITAKYGLPAVAIEQEITELAKSKNK